MICVICSQPLTGGIDTFGPLGLESCRTCWMEHGISGPYDPWEQLQIANRIPGDVRYLDAASKNVTVTLPKSKEIEHGLELATR